MRTNVSLQALCALSPLVRRVGISRNRQCPDLSLLPQRPTRSRHDRECNYHLVHGLDHQITAWVQYYEARGDYSATACQSPASGLKSRDHGRRMPVVQVLPLATACWGWRTDHLPRSMERRRYPDATAVADHVRKLSFSLGAVFPRQHHANMRNFGSRS